MKPGDELVAGALLWGFWQPILALLAGIALIGFGLWLRRRQRQQGGEGNQGDAIASYGVLGCGCCLIAWPVLSAIGVGITYLMFAYGGSAR